jgi:hypothetical protein
MFFAFKNFQYGFDRLMPTLDIPHSSYNFNAYINSELAKKAFNETKINPQAYENFNERGKLLISKIFKIKPSKKNSDFEPYHFLYNKNDEETFLLRGVSLPFGLGDACDLSLDGSDVGDLQDRTEKFFQYHPKLRYVPHNIDNAMFCTFNSLDRMGKFFSYFSRRLIICILIS